MKELTLYQIRCKNAFCARQAKTRRANNLDWIKYRFWSKVDVRGPNDCWLWTAMLDGCAYGKLKIKEKSEKAHRLAWIFTNGPIPEGLLVCHKCDVPPCCNPNHLFLGTDKDNAQDCLKKGRWKNSKGENHGMHKLSEKQVVELRHLYDSGKTCTQLARIFGIARGNTSSIINGSSWGHIPCCVPRRPEGENHGQHKVSIFQVCEIRRLYKPRCVTMQSLSDRFGLTISCIYDIIHRKSWKHVTPEKV